MKFTKGSTPKKASYARGGAVCESVTTRSRFLKVPDTFRTDVQRTDYGGKKDPLAKPIEKKA